MRTTFKIALASVLVFTLAAAAPELRAQARRSTTTTSTSSSSDNKSATASRSAGTTANRQSTSTASRSTSSATRSTAAPAASSSSQVNRGTSTQTTRSTTTNQNNRSTATNRSTTSTGTSGQVNRGTANNNGTTGNTGTAVRRSAGTSTNGSTAARSTTSAARSTTGAAEAPSTQTRSTASRVVRSNTTSSKGLTSAPEAEAARANVTRGGAQTANRGAVANVNNYAPGRDNGSNIRMDEGRNLNRIPPRERDFIGYDRLGSFYGRDPHFFGYRVQTLPPRYRRVTYWGRTYYYYNNIYYLAYGNWYVVSRPPFGIALDIALSNAAFASVRFSYYHNVYRTFNVVDRNYRTILEQNREIARNNALLAQQNAALALNSTRATSAYEIANALGLVQSFANINTEYFYEDGVFYVVNKKGRYEVIVPPAGALVNELPDDYDTIVLNGVEYYKVDDTVYRLVLVEGIPALEVLGQMYGDMARKYNYYY